MTTVTAASYCIVPGKCPWVLAAQAPKIMGGWYVAQRKCLNGSATPDAKLAAEEPNQLPSSLCLCFVEASPMVEKAVLC